MRCDADRLSDMLEAASKIEERITGEFEAFVKDEMLQVWVIHHLQILGEAARHVSPALVERNPEVPWPQIIALRNIVVHKYFGLNLQQVWMMAQRELPPLKEQIRRIHAALSGS